MFFSFIVLFMFYSNCRQSDGKQKGSFAVCAFVYIRSSRIHKLFETVTVLRDCTRGISKRDGLSSKVQPAAN